MWSAKKRSLPIDEAEERLDTIADESSAALVPPILESPPIRVTPFNPNNPLGAPEFILVSIGLPVDDKEPAVYVAGDGKLLVVEFRGLIALNNITDHVPSEFACNGLKMLLEYAAPLPDFMKYNIPLEHKVYSNGERIDVQTALFHANDQVVKILYVRLKVDTGDKIEKITARKSQPHATAPGQK